MYYHLAAHALRSQRPLDRPDRAWWLWHRLRAAWPDALAASLMPNHLHLLVETESPGTDAARLGRLLRGFTRHIGGHRLWRPVPDPILLRDRRKLELHICYVHLNPCEPGLVTDPACWPWSTHRELLGAVADAWVPAGRLAAVLRRSAGTLPRWAHDRVMNSPKLSAGARAPLVAAPPRSVAAVPLGIIVRAAAAATPWGPRSRRRQAVVLLAEAQGWQDTSQLAAVTGLGRRSVQMLLARKDPALLSAASLCLGDERLRGSPRDIAPLVRSRGREIGGRLAAPVR
jgi:hypothetical protein